MKKCRNQLPTKYLNNLAHKPAMRFYLQSRSFATILLLLIITITANAQQASDSLLEVASLENVVAYALKHQPAVQQTEIDERIVNQTIRGRLADWYPQINFGFNYTRFIDLQASVIGGEVRRFGAENTSSAQFTATQNIFNRDVLLASNTASKVRLAASQNSSRSKINAVVQTTKAFYDVLTTLQQIKVSEESIVRLERSLKDAQARYSSGVADKTDYKRAMILLSNAKASLKANQEREKSGTEYLKSVIGYPVGSDLKLVYDSLQMENEVALDTTQVLNYADHIDYKLLTTQRELQTSNVKYSYWAFLPSLTLNGAYNLNYQNDNFNDLYSARFPFSFVGATLAVPIFQGGKRIAKIREQKWTSRRMDYDLVYLRSGLNTQFEQAMASYKSNLANYLALKENMLLAEEVYNIIHLQYRNGVKAYLDVTIAETELRTSRINYFNALNAVLVSKLDVQRALGQINY
jgi:outer membrane protein